MQKIPRYLSVLFGALLALPFAMGWLFAPEASATALGISLDGPAAFNHMRGDTGGAFFAIGALAILGVFRKEPGYLEATSFIMVSIIVGRLVGVALDGFDSQIGSSIAVEAITATVTLLTARQFRVEAGSAE